MLTCFQAEDDDDADDAEEAGEDSDAESKPEATEDNDEEAKESEKHVGFLSRCSSTNCILHESICS